MTELEPDAYLYKDINGITKASHKRDLQAIVDSLEEPLYMRSTIIETIDERIEKLQKSEFHTADSIAELRELKAEFKQKGDSSD